VTLAALNTFQTTTKQQIPSPAGQLPTFPRGTTVGQNCCSETNFTAPR